MMNRVILVGRLGADPEVRYTGDGSMVVNMRIATSEMRKGKSGELEEKTEWHRVVAFGKLAEVCGKYLSKGKLVLIEGRIETRSWEDKQGVKRTTTQVIASDMRMLEAKRDGAAPQGRSEPGADIPF